MAVAVRVIDDLVARTAAMTRVSGGERVREPENGVLGVANDPAVIASSHPDPADPALEESQAADCEAHVNQQGQVRAKNYGVVPYFRCLTHQLCL